MLQRIQSVFLFLAAMVSGVLSWFVNLWRQGTEWMQTNDYLIVMVLFLVSAAMSLGVIFLYKDRPRQMAINRMNMGLNIVLVGLLIYYLFTLPGEGMASEKGIGLFLPLAAIILLFLANRGIRKDDKLVKSIDRLR